MGSFVEHIKEKAKQTKKTILLPETMDDRTYYAAEQAMKEGIADLILIGSRAEIDEHVKSTGVDISGARIVDPANYEKSQRYDARGSKRDSSFQYDYLRYRYVKGRRC